MKEIGSCYGNNIRSLFFEHFINILIAFRYIEFLAHGIAAFFTIDAGPQVKVICMPGDESQVVDALSSTPGVETVLTSGIGAGAARVNGD